MANNRPLMTSMIAEGRINTEVAPHYGLATVITVDLEHLATRMVATLIPVFQSIPELRVGTYFASEQLADRYVNSLVTNMVGAAVALCYNRLRNVADRYSTTVRAARMNPRSPINSRIEFPTFIASTIGSIGPLRIEDGPRDTLILYATESARANTFGRTAAFEFNPGLHDRLIRGLRAANIPLSTIDVGNVEHGSFFSTITPRETNFLWDFSGTVHRSHYEHDDIIKSFMTCALDVNYRAFPFVGMIIGETRREATTTAIAADRPEGVAATLTSAEADETPIGHIFNTNIFGIHKAVAAAEGREATPASAWIVGRGTQPYYNVSLARNIARAELFALLKERLLVA